MRKTSKLLALVLAVLMMLSIASVSVSAQYTDVSVDDEALNDAVNLLTTLKIAYGTTDTTFAPNENVTRQQMAAFVYRLMKAGKQVTGGDNTTAFTDLDDSTFYYMVSWASKNGIIKGTSATTFNPKGGITLQDCYVMLVRALGYEKETTLPYPIGFIDEAERIGLDENLPSDLQYTDTLTRGNVAIILANAFYAEMNEVTTKYEWIDNGKTGSEKTWAYMPTEVAETVAHKIFGVVEETFEVRATAHYGFGSDKPLYGDKNDVDRITGIRYDEDDNAINGGKSVTIEMKDLGLAGSSDDYFLAQLTLFVKKDSSDYTKDEFLAAKSNLVKKTATAADVVLETSTKTDKEYYVGGVKDKSKDKVMTGYATFAGIKAYLDKENAPYSYTDVDKKDAVEFIEMSAGSYDKDGDSTFEYDAVGVNFDGLYDAAGTNGSHDKLSTEFETKFPRIYNKGLYELDVYDIDGDGYAEYVMEKPYQFAKVEVKKNKDYAGLKGSSYPKTFNTESAVINGTYADKDYVLGYFPTNGSTVIPYVEIKEVVKPVESMVIAKSNGDDSKTATLKSGEVIEFVDADKKLMNYNGYTIASVGAGKSYKMYVKDGVLLYSDNLSTDGFDSAANYAIVLKYDDANATKYVLGGTTTTTSNPRVVYDATGVSNGEFKTYLYVNAVMGGAVKAVKLADYAYTHIDYANNAYTKTNDVESLKITDKTVAETVMYEDFLGKFATYTVDGESAYTFTALDIQDATHASTVFADKDNEDSIVYYGDSLTMKHYTGAIYSITDKNIGGMTRFNVKDYTKFIVKTVDDDNEDVYTEYTLSTLPKFDTTKFTNVKAIFVNNKNSNIENLGILYAEIDEFGSSGSKDYRVVTAVTTELNSNNKEIQKVTVLDPKTGNTASAETASGYTASVGNVVEMQEDGKVKKATIGTSYVEEKIFSATLADYDEDNKFMTLVGDTHTYIVDDTTTILYYTKSSEYEMTDTDVLVNGSDNTIMDLEDGDKVRLYVVAEDGDDKDNDDIVKAKTIIALDKTASLLS